MTILRQRLMIETQLPHCSLIEWTFMRQILEFRSNFENIFRDCRAIVARQSQDICESVSRRSHECSLFSFSFVRQSRDIRESVVRHMYECRLVLFYCQIVTRCSHVFSRLSRERKFCIVNSPKFSATGSRHSHERQSCEIFW